MVHLRTIINQSLLRLLVAGVGGVYAVLSISLIVVLLTTQIRLLNQQLISQSQTYGKLLAQSTLQATLINDLIAIDEIITAAEQLPDILSLTVLDSHGNILGATNHQLIGKYYLEERGQIALKTYLQADNVLALKPIQLNLEMSDVEMAIPQIVNDRLNGMVVIRMGGKSTLQKIHRYILYTLILGALALVFGAGMILVFGKKIVAALNQLSLAVSEYTIGSELPLVPDHRADEIGKLAKQFKTLMLNLNLQDAQIKQNQKELESKVQERTATLAEKTEELAKINKFFISRELRMAELKTENELLRNEMKAVVSGAQTDAL